MIVIIYYPYSGNVDVGGILGMIGGHIGTQVTTNKTQNKKLRKIVTGSTGTSNISNILI